MEEEFNHKRRLDELNRKIRVRNYYTPLKRRALEGRTI